jgi:hypothetical protein
MITKNPMKKHSFLFKSTVSTIALSLFLFLGMLFGFFNYWAFVLLFVVLSVGGVLRFFYIEYLYFRNTWYSLETPQEEKMNWLLYQNNTREKLNLDVLMLMLSLFRVYVPVQMDYAFDFCMMFTYMYMLGGQASAKFLGKWVRGKINDSPRLFDYKIAFYNYMFPPLD